MVTGELRGKSFTTIVSDLLSESPQAVQMQAAYLTYFPLPP